MDPIQQNLSFLKDHADLLMQEGTYYAAQATHVTTSQQENKDIIILTAEGDRVTWIPYPHCNLTHKPNVSTIPLQKIVFLSPHHNLQIQNSATPCHMVMGCIYYWLISIQK